MRDDKQIAAIIAGDFGANATYVEDLLRQYRVSPSTVGDEWEDYFAGLLGESKGVNGTNGSAARVMAKEGFVKHVGVKNEPTLFCTAPPEEPDKEPPPGPKTEGCDGQHH